MTTGAWITLGLTWSVIICIATGLFVRVLRADASRRREERPPGRASR